MPTKLSRYAEGVMEAAWLAAVVVIPLFFNVYSSRIFEPDKITLLRSLSLILLAAWFARLIEEGRLNLRPGKLREGLRTLLRTPLTAPVAALVGVYLVATVFSVTPYTSFWGSYQRLQGTYTTLSYVVIFATVAVNLRKSSQVERLVTTAILTSLPICLYGILQRFQMDPIPWGGNVSARIAANLGNSIFVAAFLIMVFPLTVMRIVSTLERLVGETKSGAHFIQATIYIFILTLQIAALYFSGSRGPWLGWGASLVTLWLGLSLIWRKRWMTISGIVLAILMGSFLVVLNIPNGPLDGLRARPEFGRLGQLLDAESRTGRVRTLIWQGAFELVQPHSPLEFPDGRKDAFNLLRPLIGYGPESMYVAYNRFYQPELTEVEKRNASPDRSHNETWDSLVITGLLGLAVYLTLFGSAIFYALKWLGFAPGRRERNLFLALYLGCGAAVAIAFALWKGPGYLGVALPFGMVFGVLVYLTIVSLLLMGETEARSGSRGRDYLMLALLAAVTAHFVEINFGIAISATRTYFFVYLALILLIGHVFPRAETLAKEAENLQTTAGASGMVEPAERQATLSKGRPGAGRAARKKRGSVETRPARRIAPWILQAVSAGLIIGLMIGTLGYSVVSNASRGTGALGLVASSLTQLADGSQAFGVLALALTVWLAGCLLLASEGLEWLDGAVEAVERPVAKTTTLTLGVAAAVGLIFWIWHASGLAALNRVTATDIGMVLAQVARSEGLLTRYYLFLFGVVFALGAALPLEWPAVEKRSSLTAIAAGMAMAAALIAAGVTNLRVIQADISFKTGDVFGKPGSWPIAIQIYNRARQLAPNEDYYYLFLGRAYLEHAKTLENGRDRELIVTAAAADLKEAQRINPLNTDHTANLARLYSLWTGFTEDPMRRAELAVVADDYFEGAIALSPQNSRLWDERAAHTMNYLDDPETAFTFLQQALALDPSYDWTYGLIGDYYARFRAAQEGISQEQKTEILLQAADYYTRAVSLGDSSNLSQLNNYLLSFGSVKAQVGDLPAATAAYERAMIEWPDQPERWRVEVALAQLYEQLGDYGAALRNAQAALASAPEEQRPAIEDLVRRLDR